MQFSPNCFYLIHIPSILSKDFKNNCFQGSLIFKKMEFTHLFTPEQYGTPMKIKNPIGIHLILYFLLFSPIFADTIILKSQKSYKGKVINQDENSVTFLDDGNSRIIIKKTEILKIYYKDLEDSEIKQILKDSAPKKKKVKEEKVGEDNSEDQTKESNTPRKSGLKLNLGIWGGPMGHFSSNFENLNSTDNLFSGFRINRISQNGERKNRNYLFLPIGLHYYIPSGIGSFELGVESRGNNISPTAFGFSTKYNYNSFTQNSLGIHNSVSKFSNIDWSFGYDFFLPGNLVSLTPKFLIRQFHETYKEDYNLFFPVTPPLQQGSKYYETRAYKSYFGLKTVVHITNQFSIYADMVTTDWIPLLEMPSNFLLRNKTTYNELRTYETFLYVQDSGTMKPAVSGNRKIFGLSYKWENLQFNFGVHNEIITYKYSNASELPFVLGRFQNSISFSDLISKYFLDYRDSYKTEIKSFFIEMEYSFE